MRSRRLSVFLFLMASGCSEPHSPITAASDVARFERSDAPHFERSEMAPFIATAMSVTERHSCAFAPGSDLQCWGTNSSGQIGIGSVGGIVYAPMKTGTVKFKQVSVGGAHTCALDGEGAAYCWGSNVTGALGTGNTAASSAPIAVDTDLRFASIGAGNSHSCALTATGAAFCWGSNAFGAVGSETSESCMITPTRVAACATRPTPVSGGYAFTALEVGLWNGCGLTSDGVARCWGNNLYGQMGTGVIGPARNVAPRPIVTDVRFATLSVGAAHMCGIAITGVAYCWGYNQYGALGTGTMRSALLPVAVATGGRQFTAIAANDGNSIANHTCAVDADSQMYCWGANTAGQLGIDVGPAACGSGRLAFPCELLPVAVRTELNFASIDVGIQHSCGISTQRRLFCWGDNSRGALGNAGVDPSTSIPTPVATWEKRGARNGQSPPFPIAAIMDEQ